MHDHSTQLSAAVQHEVRNLSERHGFSVSAVSSMLVSVIDGNGSMAQFNHPEFGGPGQWMKGGMTMVSDMSDTQLKGRVDKLCEDVSKLVANQEGLTRNGSFQSQSQGDQRQDVYGGDQQGQGRSEPGAPVSASAASAESTGNWWPAGLGSPNSTGGQNDIRYAYFGQAHRLAIEANGKLTVYDTLDHNIGGISQQQSAESSLSFTSQHGPVDIAKLPVVPGV